MIKSSVKKQILKNAGPDQRAGLETIVDRYSKGGWENVPRKKFNGNEGWFPSDNDKRIRLEAFKPWQLRAYGFCEQFNERQTFFITGVYTSKKQDRADQNILAKAGKEAVRVHDEIRKAGGKNVPRAQ